MKNSFAVSLLIVLLMGLVLLSVGCSTAQPGETTAEGHRNHLRTLRVNRQEMMADIDRTLGLDQPSKLTDKKIP
jgi:hypothetical protein